MASFQLFVKTIVGKTNVYEVKKSMTVKDLKHMVHGREGYPLESLFLTYNGRVLSDDDQDLADANVQANSTVYVLMRMLGGGNVDPDTLFQLICFELDSYLAQAKHTTKECTLCTLEDIPCVTICHLHYCDGCLKSSMMTGGFSVLCTCGIRREFEAMVPVLKPLIQEFRDVKKLLHNIDVQLCECGTIGVNETLLASTKCVLCKRVSCFFCNRKWDPAKMQNNKYFCSESCFYKANTKFELVSLTYSTGDPVQVPNRRTCPSCGNVGAYDQKCKYHECTCGHKFCFICLKTEAACKATGSSYGVACPLAQQTFSSFPHLLPH